MTTVLNDSASQNTSACAEFPQVFSSPYLEPFDEATYFETQEDAGIEHEEALMLLPAAQARHEEIQPRAVAAAKEICASCPLLNECRDWVLSLKDQKDVYGVVAGMTLDERRSARRALARQKSQSLRVRNSVTVPSSVEDTTSQKISETAQRLLRTR